MISRPWKSCSHRFRPGVILCCARHDYGQQYMTWNDRITFDPAVMSGKPCIRGMRVTVGTVVGLVAEGRSEAEILAAYPYLESADIRAALAYAAWRSEERDVPLTSA
jgi:uncharacterized protein (DUF433 family)